MKAYFSYIVAGVIVVIIAVWLGTGVFVQGGKGPGNGERPVVALVEPNGGALTNTIDAAGLQAHGEEHAEGQPDPHLTIAEREAETSGDKAAARSVRVKTFVAKPMPIEVPLRGQTRAKASVTAAAETTGIVATVEVNKGQTVKTGDLLCTLDTGTRQAAVAQAEAGLAQAQTAFDSNAALVKKGVAAANTATAAEAALRSAQAALDQAKAELERTQIKAKSDGIIQDPLTTVGSMLAAGAPCATVVQMDPIVFAGNVPEKYISLAKLGLPATLNSVTGVETEGKVSYIAAVADEATRSFPIEIEIPNADGKLLAGVSATATINIGTAPAQLLPQSVLTLDDEGTLGVRAVADSKVVFHPVTIVKDTREGIWVTGLPLSLDIITVGQDFVQAGQSVTASKADGA